jgi:hypothetical protein
VATVAFSVDPSYSPSGTFTPSVVIPRAAIIIRSFPDPVDHHHRHSPLAGALARVVLGAISTSLVHPRPTPGFMLAGVLA